MGLAENIKFFREKKGMHQSDLGRYLGVSAQAVSKWECGKSEPDQSSIVKMCQVFDISSDQLFGIETKPKPTNEPKTPEARIFASWADNATAEQRAKALRIMDTIFDLNAEKFKEGAANDDT